MGLDQVAALGGQMDGLLRAQGLTKGSVGARMTALGKQPRFLYPDTDEGRAELIAYLNGLVAGIRPRLPLAFATLPRADLVIKRVPPDIEAGAPARAAAPAAEDSRSRRVMVMAGSRSSQDVQT